MRSVMVLMSRSIVALSTSTRRVRGSRGGRSRNVRLTRAQSSAARIGAIVMGNPDKVSSSILPAARHTADSIEIGSQQTKAAIAKATMVCYEHLRDLPREQQTRVLVAAAVLIGRADDLIDALTGKVRL